MNNQHTPGPWMAHGPAKPTVDAPEGGDFCIQDGGTNVIAEAFFRVSEGSVGTRNAEANANLMAAAPEMAEALDLVIRRLQADIDDGGRPDQWSMEDLVRKAKDALPAAWCIGAA